MDSAWFFRARALHRAGALMGWEWLVTDQCGGFAMGATAGPRTRKYHGFYVGASGRSETVFLSDFEMALGSEPLWPHFYRAGDTGQVIRETVREPIRFEAKPGPKWFWEIDGTHLELEIRPERESGGGMRFQWHWTGDALRDGRSLTVRPFLGLRALHGIGGNAWRISRENSSRSFEIQAPGLPALEFHMSPGVSFIEAEQWNCRFHYPEEEARGYESQENLFSGGYFESTSGLLEFSLFPKRKSTRVSPHRALLERKPLSDFLLAEPPGVVAGFPWFGEWGRDTFIALPGILAADFDNSALRNWALGLLDRWALFVRRGEALPNLLARDGEPSRDSADATLWWTHALAALWYQARARKDLGFAEQLRKQFAGDLSKAIALIQADRHVHLRFRSADQLIEVTGPHATWMDARVDGQAVTPRTGVLPEINALWSQAYCLQLLWRDRAPGVEEISKMTALAKAVLEPREQERPNFVFLHSLPFAPSWLVGDTESLERDLRILSDRFWTPGGLRTLDPARPEYRPRYEGTQTERDLSYHQGVAWAWLGSHYEMARMRLESKRRKAARSLRGLPDFLQAYLDGKHADASFPIEGHVPELYEGEEPFAPCGAPAQAWSLACLEELRFRALHRFDPRGLSRIRPKSEVSA